MFIIGVLLALLLPAVQAARARAQATVCKNNLRQLAVAMNSYVGTFEQIPEENLWTVAVLPWIEERPLADLFSAGDAATATAQRPTLFRCPSQPEVDSTVQGVWSCHYAFTLYQPRREIDPRSELQRTTWIHIHDREELSEGASYEPWYVGLELIRPTDDELFASGTGPHQAGQYHAANSNAEIRVFPR